MDDQATAHCLQLYGPFEGQNQALDRSGLYINTYKFRLVRLNAGRLSLMTTNLV